MKKILLVICFIVFFLLDQITKSLIRNNIRIFETKKMMTFFNIVYVTNKGGAFGIFADFNINQYFFIIMVILILTILLYIVRGLHFLFVAIILAGVFGNVYDRIVYNRVLDFIDFHVINIHYPSFNIADLYVVMSIILIFYNNIILIQDTKK